jgi:hypothetical protein
MFLKGHFSKDSNQIGEISMKTRMKKLISISTIPVLALVLLLVLGTVLSDGAAAQAKKPAPSLTCTITYDFVGHYGIFDAEGRLLVWDGEIHGDIEGRILWWFVLDGGPPIPDTAHVSFYEARWEIFDEEADPEVDPPLLAGDSAGTTAKPPGKDGIWRGNGKVTEAHGAFTEWDGRQTYEAGNVNWDFPYSGSGTFRVN